EWNPETQDVRKLVELVKSGVEHFASEYHAYFTRNQQEGDQIFESAPRVILIPGIGMVNTGKSYAMSKVSGALYRRAIAV
ncbi:bifunctional rhamnulose-1-phosphate aldolase/short-chain dehydrogenase, partial [Bacillus vallismortis]|nr:bifunctional rhamnulose-1-phosphate aldolase/short-chain dehydrogenase [Bacillus vallismortis]